MAKNEIRHRLSLEGDDEVKRKLQAVGEVGKRSMADIESKLGNAKTRLGDIGAPIGKLKESLASLTEGAGIDGMLGRFGSLLSRAATGPAGIVSALTAAVLGVTRLGDGAQKAKGRLEALGGKGIFKDVSAQAKALGTDVASVSKTTEQFLSYEAKARARDRSIIHPPGFVPGASEERAAAVNGPTSPSMKLCSSRSGVTSLITTPQRRSLESLRAACSRTA